MLSFYRPLTCNLKPYNLIFIISQRDSHCLFSSLFILLLVQMSIHPSTHHSVSIYHVPVTVWELSIQKWTGKVISLLSWSLNFTHPPSIQYSYTEPHSTWKIWAALGTKVFFLICWTDHNTLKTCDGSLSSCKQLIALDSLAPQTQPDHLQVFTCSHSSAIPPLPFLFPFNFSFSLAVSLPSQVWPWVTSTPYVPDVASLRPDGKESC